ncbi:pheST operon leader peptide PheM [Pantoea sp. XAF26B01_ASV70]
MNAAIFCFFFYFSA